MGDSLAAFAVVLLLALLIVPFVALAMVIGARKRIAALEGQVEARKNELRYLYEQLTALKKAGVSAAPSTADTEDTAPARPATEPNEFRLPAEAPTRATNERNEFRPPADAPARATNERNEFRPPAEAPAGATNERNEFRPPAEAGARATNERNEFRPPAEAPARATNERNEARPEGTPPTPPPRSTPKKSPPPPTPSVPFEQRLATYFTRIGAAALLLGALYFFKYAADNEWIGPAGRVLIGAIAGIATIAFAEYTRKTTRPAYTQILVGVGLALLYICAWASAVLYQLVSIPAAFAAETIILFLGAALAYRYKGEAVLILVLIAGFANPVLLSTGVDRPLALFAYLLLLTSVAVAVSIAREFKLTIALAIAGVTVLFAGWYDKYFQVHDYSKEAWAGDRPPEELIGAYHALGARIVPLAAAAAFLAQHLGTALILKKRDRLQGWIKPLAVIAVLLAHVAATALLYDRPHALGLTMVGLAALTVLAFRYFETTKFLLIPMGAAFMLLAGLTAETRSEDQLVLLGMLGIWAAIYLGAFLYQAWKENQELPKNSAIQASVGLALFTILGLISLFNSDRPLAAAILLAAVSIGFVAISLRAKMTALILIALLCTLAPMGAAGAILLEDQTYLDYRFLAAAAVYSAIYVAAIARQLTAHKETKWLSLLTVSLATLSFLALVLAGTHENVPTLRALATAAIGIADLVFAMFVQRRRKDLQPWVQILAAQALALFAPAVAFGLSGATITVAWAVLAGTSMLILAEAKDRVWFTVATLLIACTLFRVFAIDVQGVIDAISEYQWSGGRRGVLGVPAFFNARAYAFASSGLAFLGGALWMVRSARKTNPPDKSLLIYAPIVITIAYALLTALLIVEVRTALQTLPAPPPMPLDNEEFALFMETVRNAKTAQHNLLAMTTTVILALIAMSLLGIGFAAKDPFHRYLGLALFLGTVGKLVVWDVWNLERKYQIVVLIIVGALLLGSGFLYARLKALFRGETAAVAILILALALDPRRAEAQKPEAPQVPIHLYESTAPLEDIKEPGDYLFRVPPELYRKSTSANLFADVRIAASSGEKRPEIPFVVRVAPPREVPQIANPRMFDPGQIAGGGYRATFELDTRVEHCEVELFLLAPTPFLRRTKIETGEKLDDLQLVSSGAIVYAVDVQGVRTQSSTVRYPPSLAKYIRVTLLPDPDAGLTEIQGAKLWCARPEYLPRVERVPLTIVGSTKNEETKATELELDAGGEGIPLDHLVLRVKTPELVRRVQVLASSYKTAWPAVGSSVIYRVANTGGEGPESISIPIAETRKRHFKVVIFDGNDAPIDIAGVEGSYPERQLIFRTPVSGAHQLYAGDKTDTDAVRSYDLAEILNRRTDELNAKPATLGALVPNPAFGKGPQLGEVPITERYRKAIGIALAIILVLLGIWAVRLVKEKG